MTTAPEHDLLDGSALRLVPQPRAGRVPRLLVQSCDGASSSLLPQLHQDGFAVLLLPGPVGPDELLGTDLVLVEDDDEQALAQLQALRALDADMPVVVVLRTGSFEQVLEQGADDCLEQTAAHAELAVRLRAALRRRGRPDVPDVLRSGEFVLDAARHLFARAGNSVHLPPKEFGLLALLMRRDGRVVAREEALEAVWGQRASGDPSTVDVHVKRLRAKLEADPSHPRHLLTVRGMGYRFEA